MNKFSVAILNAPAFIYKILQEITLCKLSQGIVFIKFYLAVRMLTISILNPYISMI